MAIEPWQHSASPVRRRPGHPSRPPRAELFLRRSPRYRPVNAPPPPTTTAPILNPKIDSGVPLRRAPVPAAGGSSLTSVSPPTPENRLNQKSIQSTEVWLNRSRAAARARGRAAAAGGRASDRARAGAAAAARASESRSSSSRSGWYGRRHRRGLALGRATVEMSPAAPASR